MTHTKKLVAVAALGASLLGAGAPPVLMATGHLGGDRLSDGPVDIGHLGGDSAQAIGHLGGDGIPLDEENAG